MIDWDLTKTKFGRTGLTGRRPNVVVVCDNCGKTGQKKVMKKSDVIDNQLSWLCKKCECNTQEYKNKVSKVIKQKWENEEYRKKASKANKDKWDKPLRDKMSKQVKNRDNHEILSEVSKLRWEDEEYRKKMKRILSLNMIKKWQDDDYKANMSRQATQLWEDEEYRDNQVKSSINLWENEEYRNKVITSLKNQSELISEKQKQIWSNEHLIKETTNRSIAAWRDKDLLNLAKKRANKLWGEEEYINKQKLIHESEEYRDKLSAKSKELWKDDKYRADVTNKIREKWKNETYRRKMAIIRSKQPCVSSIQECLYSILDDLGIDYHREYEDKQNQETVIGPYNFDCVIPLNNKTLLIECQGDYWHSIDAKKNSDKSKATYIERYHKDCEIKYLWEHEFKCRGKVVELIKYWTGKITFELTNFSFDDVKVKKCKANDYKLLLSKYHYLPNAGRGGNGYGAYMDDKLIAICIFSPLIRQNLPWDKNSTRELSRLCIHPKYQKKNFASWFVSRCIKELPDKYNTIISYCDTTFNHDGIVYKACNFRLDGEVKPDYWYVSEDGWVMHKKTLYNHAKKMNTKESVYAIENGYKKVLGKKKLRFIYER